MLGSSSYYLCAMSLALACSVSANLNMNHLCGLVNDGHRIAAYDACDTFYICQNGVATRQSCSPGNYFDKESQTCLTQAEVKCLAPSNVPCSSYNVGSWAPVTGSCTAFYYCSPNGPERSSCPKGQNFNPNLEACVYPTQYPCTETPSAGTADGLDNSSGEIIKLPLNLCNFFGNSMFFGSASSCSGWNKCINNVMQSGNCPNGLLYNVLTMDCNYADEVSCSQVTNDPLLSATTCSTKNTMKAGPSCDTYFVCDGSYFQLKQCPGDLFFDTVSKMCVNRLEARNDCDRCLGATRNFANAYSASDCSGYLYCQNGVTVSSGTCAAGSYFDERTGVCLIGASEPLLGCCNPAYFNRTISGSMA